MEQFYFPATCGASKNGLWFNGGTLSKAAKERLGVLLDDRDAGVLPVPMDAACAPNVTAWISSGEAAALEAVAQEHGLTGASEAASALLHAEAAGGASPAPAEEGPVTVLDEINLALGDQTRPDQAKFYAGIVGEFTANRPQHEVIFAEASTGIGKTRAFLAAALAWSGGHPDEHAIIALPGYASILQTVGQWRAIAAGHDVPDWEILVGMQEFVSKVAIQDLLTDHAGELWTKPVADWVAAGAPAPTDDYIGHRWLARSLLAVTANEEFPYLSEALLDSEADDEDPGKLAYRSQFLSGRSSRIVFCTHSMLAHDLRLRLAAASKRYQEESGTAVSEAAWAEYQQDAGGGRKAPLAHIKAGLLGRAMDDRDGRLPPVGLLIVDEAHLLEQNFANVFATGISMTRLLADVRAMRAADPRGVRKADLDAIEAAWADLRDFGRENGTERNDAMTTPGLRDAMRSVAAALTAIGQRLKGAARTVRASRKVIGIARSLEMALKAQEGANGMSVRVTWSPTYHWPSITVGRHDVSKELAFLWSHLVEDRSVLVSATLFEDFSASSSETMRRILSVPVALLRALPPIRPAWLTAPVTVVQPARPLDADDSMWLRRPTKRDHEQLPPAEWAARRTAWLRDLAAYINDSYATAAGGMLVLCTAHSDRAALLPLLTGIPVDCLLTHGEGVTLGEARRRFLVLAASGKRACLVGVGSAWTGLDLSGGSLAEVGGENVPPGKDVVLTDLVIPVAPIGVNRTLTHEWRKSRSPGLEQEIAAMAISLRQGIGRLVRRDGLPWNRRLHFLDARLQDDRHKGLMGPAMRALRRYERHADVNRPQS